MAARLRDFVPVLRQRVGMYVPRATFLATCGFIDGYSWGSDDETFDGFHAWMVHRDRGRPELGWPWLVLCEIFPANDLPDPRSFTEEQDRAAVALLFDLLEEFYRSTP